MTSEEKGVYESDNSFFSHAGLDYSKKQVKVEGMLSSPAER